MCTESECRVQSREVGKSHLYLGWHARVQGTSVFRTPPSFRAQTAVWGCLGVSVMSDQKVSHVSGRRAQVSLVLFGRLSLSWYHGCLFRVNLVLTCLLFTFGD